MGPPLRQSWDQPRSIHQRRGRSGWSRHLTDSGRTVAMSLREFQVHEIRKVLRLWRRAESDRPIGRLSLADRKIVKRYRTAGW